MDFAELVEMAKAISAKTCGKCGNDIVDRNYYYYKGQYFHKGGCQNAATSTTPAQQPAGGTSATPSAPAAPVQRPTPAPAANSPQQTIRAWLVKHDVQNFVIDPNTNEVDVDGDVFMDIDDIKKLPVKFRKVTGSFNIAGSDIETLEGCPQIVGRHFDCSETDIKSFEHGPQQVGGAYKAENCSYLASLKGLPRVVPGLLHLGGASNVSTLEGIPEQIGSLFLPASPFNGHNIHKMVKHIKNSVILMDPKSYRSTNLLGLLFIDGIRDGFEIKGDRKLEKFLNAVMDIRHVEVEDDPENPRLPYRDVLDVQEKLIDAGYGKFAKL